MARLVRSARVLPLAALKLASTSMALLTEPSIQPASGVSTRGEDGKILWITLWVEQTPEYALLDFSPSQRYDSATNEHISY
jgi:hypothetical protein